MPKTVNYPVLTVNILRSQVVGIADYIQKMGITSRSEFVRLAILFYTNRGDLGTRRDSVVPEEPAGAFTLVTIDMSDRMRLFLDAVSGGNRSEYVRRAVDFLLHYDLYATVPAAPEPAAPADPAAPLRANGKTLRVVVR